MYLVDVLADLESDILNLGGESVLNIVTPDNSISMELGPVSLASVQAMAGLTAATTTIASRAFGTIDVTDFVQGTDQIDLSVFNVADLLTLMPYMREQSGDVYIETYFNDITGGSPNEVIIIRDISIGDLTAADFIFNTSTTAVVIDVPNTRENVFFGGNGDDELTGGGDTDELNGGAGDDVLNAGGGSSNVLRGGAGDDTFIYSEDRGNEGVTITDFTSGEDVIDVSGLGVADLATLMPYMREQGGDVYIETYWNDITGGSPNEVLVLRDTSIADLSDSDFVFNTSTAPRIIDTPNTRENIIFGGNGDDQLTAGNDTNELNGGGGDDILNAGGGYSNVLRGGEGSDTLVISEDRGNEGVFIKDFTQGQDVIDISGLGVSDLDTLMPYMRQDGADVRIETYWNDITGGSPNEVWVIENTTLGDLTSADFLFDTNANDRVIDVAGTRENVIFGNVGDDILTGNNDTTELNGAAGNDILNAGGGYSNILRGGEDDDTFLISEDRGPEGVFIEDFTSGEDVIDISGLGVTEFASLLPFMSQDGADVRIETYWNDITGGSPNEIWVIRNTTIAELSASDFVFDTTAADQTLTTSSSRDFVVFGGEGDDTLTSDSGDDILVGGGGDDLFIASTGEDDYIGGSGFDTVDYSAAGTAIRADLDNLISGTGWATRENFTDIESLIGTGFNDTLYGLSAGGSELFGGDGNDTLRGREGMNVLNGGAGDDLLFTGGTDTVIGGAGFDRLRIEDPNVEVVLVLDANSGIENILTGNGDDVINAAQSDVGVVVVSERGDDVLTGSVFNDNLVGGRGDDVISGGDGNDRLDGLAEADVLIGGNGDDLIFIDNLDTVDAGAGNDRVFIRGYATDATYDVAAMNAELVNGNIADDVLDASNATFRVDLRGQRGDDTLLGGSDGDRLSGGIGDDTIDGGAGNDRLFGGSGADTLRGGDGNDFLFVDSDDTLIEGGAGYDRVYATGASGALIIDLASAGVEFVSGSSGNDALDAIGSTAGVKLFGRDGNDALGSGDGDDFLFGGNGNDTLELGGGYDRASGGAGADVFMIKADWGRVDVLDFEDGVDLLDLSLTGATSLSDLTLTDLGAAGTQIEYNGDTLVLRGFDIDDLDAADFLF